MMNDDEEVVDPITQLVWMLAWDEDYTDEFKRQVIQKAIAYANKVESYHGA